MYSINIKKQELILMLLLLALIAPRADAQFYQNAAGLRLGNASGLTGKTLVSKRFLLEGIISTRWRGINIVALGEITQSLVDYRGLSWYYGVGAHIGFWDYPGDSEEGTKLFTGVDGIVGMEYTFDEIPLNLALDWKPFLNILSTTHFVWDEIALSVRYVIHY